MGDKFRDVRFHNATGAAIVLYEDERRDLSAVRHELAADETLKSGWLYPIESDDNRRVMVQADDMDGRLIYCAWYSYDELVRVDWRIEIIRGHNSCK